MRILLATLIFSGVAMAASGDVKDEESRALIHAVEPMNVHSGDTVLATGTFLGKKSITELYLTNGKDDVQVEILKQGDKELTFKVPAGITGRYRLMILTGGTEPKLVEQPVRIVIE